jgi:hypothetical protein
VCVCVYRAQCDSCVIKAAWLRSLQRGDCVVVFSRAKLYAAKASIEALTGLGTAVVYGALPPAVRREQAQRFNGACAVAAGEGEHHILCPKKNVPCLDTEHASIATGTTTSGAKGGGAGKSAPAAAAAADVLVATDAVGMGLNLQIRRMVFSTVR